MSANSCSKLRRVWPALRAALAFGALPAAAQMAITNVSVVNVTPAGFAVVASIPPALTSSTVVSINVYSNSSGGSLTGQVGVEYYPLNSGDPTATNTYGALLSQAALRQDAMNLGLIYARVTYCAPNTTYYFQITATNSANGQSALWPSTGPLPSATTSLQNSFVLQSQQLLVTLDDAQPAGSILMLATSNSASVLAAVVGDGAGTNQAIFNVNDLIAATGGTNYLPLGSETFSASVLGSTSSALTQTYSLVFSNNFSVGQETAVTLGAYSSTISIGTSAFLAGTSASVPIFLNSQAPLASLSFELNLATNLFTAISVQPTSGNLQSAALNALSSNTLQLTFTAAAGLNLEGSRQIAQLNFATASNQASAFVPLIPQAPQAVNTIVGASTFYLQPGQTIIIGPQPVLDMQFVAGSRNLVLYGIPGQSYQIQSETNLAQPGKWANFLRLPMTNLSQVIPDLAPVPATVFFRAFVLNADPPILQASLSGTNRSLLAFGLAGTNYTLQTAGNLSVTVAWYPLLNYTLTNSFQFFTNLGPGSPIFYRIKKQ
jgi:hypothetical protein